MTETPTTAAIAGVTGGAGATRLTVEIGTTLARAGHDVALTDVAFGTQGLADYVRGRIETDLTDLLRGEDPDPGAAAIDLSTDTDGRVVAVPSRASFQALATAKTAEAAITFETVVERLDESFEYVLVDTPPVATNPAVAAVTCVDRVALVAPGSVRGVDALQRLRARLTDVGTTDDLAVANYADDVPDASIDRAIPEDESREAATAPVCADPNEPLAPAVAATAEALFDRSLGLEFPEPTLRDRLRP